VIELDGSKDLTPGDKLKADFLGFNHAGSATSPPMSVMQSFSTLLRRLDLTHASVSTRTRRPDRSGFRDGRYLR
jgi:hypothetical protein